MTLKNGSICCFFSRCDRKSKQFLTPTRHGSRHCSTYWRPRRKCTAHNGPKSEQRWLWCGWKGLRECLNQIFVFIRFKCTCSPVITALTFFFNNQGSSIYPSLPSEPGGRRKGWQQPKPRPSQRHQSLRNSPEEVPRLVGAAALQGEFSVCLRRIHVHTRPSELCVNVALAFCFFLGSSFRFSV